MEIDSEILRYDALSYVRPVPPPFPSENTEFPAFGCEFLYLGSKSIEFEAFAPNAELIEHYGRIIAFAAKGKPIHEIVQLMLNFPSAKKFPVPSKRNILRWIVMFSRLFEQKVKNDIKGKDVTLKIDEWSAPIGGIKGKVLNLCLISQS